MVTLEIAGSGNKVAQLGRISAFSSSLYPLYKYPTTALLPPPKVSPSLCHVAYRRNMLPLSSPALLPAIAFSGNPVSSSPPASPNRLRIRPVVASATATESCSTWTEQQKSRSSYLTSLTMSSCASLYEILGIPLGASHQEIKVAYRRLARVCHPDVATVDRKDSSADEFMKIQAAYSTLSDPQKRATYDRSLFVRRQRPLSTASPYSGYTGRNWETDQCW